MLFKKLRSRKKSTGDGPKNITVSCVLNTNIITPEEVIVKPGGVIFGDIKAKSVDVNGEVNGNITALKSVILRKDSQVNGLIKTESISVEEGAKGDMSIQTTVPKKSTDDLQSHRVESKEKKNPKKKEIPDEALKRGEANPATHKVLFDQPKLINTKNGYSDHMDENPEPTFW